MLGLFVNRCQKEEINVLPIAAAAVMFVALSMYQFSIVQLEGTFNNGVQLPDSLPS